MRIITALPLITLVWLLLISGRSSSAELAPFDPMDGGDAYKAEFFESNGTFQERFGVWWLASSNPFRFRRNFTAKWYFSGIPRDQLQENYIIAKLNFAVYTNSIESGGKPTSASISVTFKNPDTDETFEVSRVRVEMNKDEVPLPTYVYVPAALMTSDGRTIVEVRGAGQIGVKQEGLVLVIPTS